MRKNIIIAFIIILALSCANVFSRESNIGISLKFGYGGYKLDNLSHFNYDCVYNSIAPISSVQFSSIESEYSDYGIILSAFLKYNFSKTNLVLLLEFDYINANSEAKTYDVNNKSNSRKSTIKLKSYPISFLLLYDFRFSKFELNFGGGVGYYYTKISTDWFAPSTSSYLVPPKDWYAGNLGFKIKTSLEYPIFDNICVGFDINYRSVKMNNFKDSKDEVLKVYSALDSKDNKLKIDLSGFHSSVGILYYF